MRSDASLWRALVFPGYATVRDELARLQALGAAGDREHQGESAGNNDDDDALDRPAKRWSVCRLWCREGRGKASKPEGCKEKEKKKKEKKNGEELDEKLVEPSGTATGETIVAGAQSALDEALLAMQRDGGFRCCEIRSRKLCGWWRRFSLFYSGGSVEVAITAVHRARAALYLLYPCRELDSEVDRLQELVGDLPELNPLRASLATALGHLRKQGTTAANLRAGMRQIYEQAIGVAESLQREARALRNAMMVSSLALAIVLAMLGFGHALNQHFIDLCSSQEESTQEPVAIDEEPVAKVNATVRESGKSSSGSGDTWTLEDRSSSSQNGNSAATASATLANEATPSAKNVKPKTTDDPTHCPLGSSRTCLDILAVELVGMLGGLLSVTIPLARGERVKAPYAIFNNQLVLKTLSGAAAAIAGVIFVESGLVPELPIQSSTAILAYAFTFGFAQQIVTGFVDGRASTLAKETIAVKSV